MLFIYTVVFIYACVSVGHMSSMLFGFPGIFIGVIAGWWLGDLFVMATKHLN